MNAPALFGSDLAADAVVEDPLDLLDLWLAGVARAGAGEPDEADGGGDVAPEPTQDATTTPLMALASVDADGDPCLRHVLLSAYGRGALHFHTDARSAKAAQLRARPRAAVTIVWPQLPRQLVVAGPVRPEPPAEAARGYARRTPYLQRLAWANSAELALASEPERRRAWLELERRPAPDGPPPTWLGLLLVAERISFWRGGPGAPSVRIVCSRADGAWSVQRQPG